MGSALVSKAAASGAAREGGPAVISTEERQAKDGVPHQLLIAPGERWERLLPFRPARGSEKSLLVWGSGAPSALRSQADVDKVLAFGPFQSWLSKVARAPSFDLREVQVESVNMFGPRVGFVKIHATVYDRFSGIQLPGICLLRGPSVSALIELVPEEEALLSSSSSSAASVVETFAPLVEQPRVAVGLPSFTGPAAGMLDGDSSFTGAAAKELEQELGLHFGPEDLLDLTEWARNNLDDKNADEGPGEDDDAAGAPADTGVYTSEGALDESIRYFYARKTVPLAAIERLRGQRTGVLEEGESIRVRVVPWRDLARVAWRDGKTLVGLKLLEMYRRSRGGLSLPEDGVAAGDDDAAGAASVSAGVKRTRSGPLQHQQQ